MVFVPYRGEDYLDWPATLAWCEAAVAAVPQWLALETLGHSREGRVIPVLVVGARGEAAERGSAFWLDAGTHCAEWTGVMAALYAVSRWVEGLLAGDPALTAWFSAHRAFVLPCVSPDGYDAMHRGEPFLRSTLRPPRDGRPRVGLDPSDLDGDGEIGWMRWRHPAGPFVFDDPARPWRVRHRTLDDDPNDAFFLASEGRFLAWDGFRWTEAALEHGMDLNRNFPGHWAPFEMFGMDGGTYPLSEPEARAMVDGLAGRPRVAAVLSNHTYTGCLLTQPYRDPSPLDGGDVALLEALAGEAVRGTGYRVIKVHPDFRYDPKVDVVGVWADTVAVTFGMPGYTLELWDPYGFAGEEVRDPARFFKEPDLGVIGRMLDAFAAADPGCVRPWRAFQHPQLGAVELGGIDYMRTVRNPPVRLLAAECERGFVVADRLRRAVPELRVCAEVEELGAGVRELRVYVENVGYLATSGLRRGERVGAAPPVVVRVVAGPGVEVEGGGAQSLGWLDGWGALQAGPARHPVYPGLPLERGHRALARFRVRGEGRLALEWDAGRAGAGSLEVAG